MNPELLNQLVLEAVPYNRLFALEFGTVTPEQVELRLHERPEYANHVGTVHAAAQYSLAEAASGAMIAVLFSDLLGQGVTPLASQATVKYKKAAAGTLCAKASVMPEEQARLRQELETNRKAPVLVQVALHDANDQVVSEMEFRWVFVK